MGNQNQIERLDLQSSIQEIEQGLENINFDVMREWLFNFEKDEKHIQAANKCLATMRAVEANQRELGEEPSKTPKSFYLDIPKPLSVPALKELFPGTSNNFTKG